ncbi:MAG: flagellar hook-length control protein FliK [Roseibium sp.]|nr:flagellar hook-length control protein FliK [Roseibium sp.]
MTDVSAGALAAGTGGLQNAGQVVAGGKQPTGFAQELSAFAQAQSLPGEGTPGFDAFENGAGLFVEELSADNLPEAGGEGDVDALTGSTGDEVPGAFPPQAETKVRTAGEEWSWKDLGSEQLTQKTSGLPPLDRASPTQGEGVADQLPGPPRSSAQGAQAQPPLGAGNKPESETALAAADGAPPKLNGAQAQPASVSLGPVAADEGAAGSQVGVGKIEAGDAKAAKTVVGSDEPSEARQVLVRSPLQDEAAGVANRSSGERLGLGGIEAVSLQSKAPLSALEPITGAVERRWQSELPQELRASAGRTGVATDPAAQIAKNAPGILGVPSDDAIVVPQANDGKNHVSVPEQPVPGQDGEPTDGAVSELLRKASGAGDNPAVKDAQTTVSDQGRDAKQQQGAPTVAAAAGVRSQNTSQHASQSAFQGAVVEGSPAAEAASVDAPLEAKPQEVVGSGKQVAVGGDEPRIGGKDKTAGGNERLEALAGRPGERAAAANPSMTGNPPIAAAAILTSQVMTEDGDVTLTDVSFTGEASATVRGGDLTGAMRTESLQTPNQAQSGHVSTQVAAEIARNLKNGQTKFQMRFDPPELGRVEVNMKVGADGSVQAHLIVERPETLDMFLRDQRGLERALEAAGLNTDSGNLQFSLKQDGGREFASGDGQSDQFGGQSDERDGSEGAGSDPHEEEIVRLTLAAQRGGLDVKI